MKNSLVQICFCTWLSLGVLAIQDLMPIWVGTKPAITLAFVAVVGSRLADLVFFPLAFIIGFAMDSLSAFPAGCAVSAVPVFAVAIRFLPPISPVISTAVAAACFEVLYSAWGVQGAAPLVLRLPVAACTGAGAGLFLSLTIPFLARHAGLRPLTRT